MSNRFGSGKTRIYVSRYLSKEIRWIDQYDENSGDPNVWVYESLSFTPATGDVVHIMGTTYGGYLYDIMNKINLSGIPPTIIDDTRATRSTGIRSVDILNEEDDYGMPGWP